MDERNTTDRSTIVASHDNGPSFLSQLIGLVLVVVLVVGVWALVTDTLPGGAPGTTVSETRTDTTLDTDRDDTNLNIEMRDNRGFAPEAPAAPAIPPANNTDIDVDATGATPSTPDAASATTERSETTVETEVETPSGG